MIFLPSARPSLLKSFWLVISVLGGLMITALLLLLDFSKPLSWGIVLALVLSLPGILQPRSISLPYAAWNKLARVFARYARLVVMAICFFIIFIARRGGAQLRLDRPNSTASLWVARGTLDPATYGCPYSATFPSNGWISALFSWTVRSHNLWALGLLPFLVMISALESGEESGFPEGIYTLF